MHKFFREHHVFLREFRRRFHTTGAVAPSSRFLARALTRCLRLAETGGGRRVLEVGPGTGSVTDCIVRHLRPDDQLDLVEINEHFVGLLEERFHAQPEWKAVEPQVRILCQPVQDVSSSQPYDLAISGLPLNNFAPAEVADILEVLAELLRGGGKLSFFEYIAIRKVKTVLGRRGERERLRGVGRVLEAFLEREIVRDTVWCNLPPAYVHHVEMSKRP